MRKIVCDILVLCLMMAMTGCAKENSAAGSSVANVSAVSVEVEKNVMESANMETTVIESSIAENSQEESESENINKDMESLSAMDIVNDMRIGWNIGNTLDSTRTDIAGDELPYQFETAWGNPQATQELIDAVLDAGFNVIRIPVSWTNHIGPEPEYLITESWMERVQEVVDYAYNKGAYVILNIHHEDWNYPYYDNLDRAAAEMEAVWGQIAEVFRDYDEHLIFEGQNEPRKVGTPLEWNGGDAEGWEVVNKTNQVFIDTVRQSGGCNPYRMLMIPGYAANCTVGIQHIVLPENDNRIIISVHAYEPYDFALNPNGRREWNHDTESIDSLMNNLKILFLDKGTPVIIGEFGAVGRENESERAEWAAYYVHAAKGIGVPCVWWDNGLFEGSGERFGLFDRHSYECRYPEILTALMQAAGQQ
ncbi:MAG: glycoside hydrolase family 5 protein [Lachnospiraceae bacterium]|nr:glycoside hydrolase family 5 protein [Lachnospiraceae bacterium]